MQTNDPANLKPSIGFLETSSIAKGILATDAMMKMANVELLLTSMLPRGKYIVMIGGTVADVQQSMRAGLDAAGALPPAIRGRVKVPDIEAVGVLETKEVASAIYAADAAVKAAAVTLIEARNVPGAKGLVVMTGEVGAVRSAMAAGAATVRKDGMIVSQIIIPYAHKALLKSLTA
jgi:microcompartment protein CcmL/EutN